MVNGQEFRSLFLVNEIVTTVFGIPKLIPIYSRSQRSEVRSQKSSEFFFERGTQSICRLNAQELIGLMSVVNFGNFQPSKSL